ncbi:MAG: hypothetical protein Q9182_005518 [Xanthomendoza sp. 2 TL-2023]
MLPLFVYSVTLMVLALFNYLHREYLPRTLDAPFVLAAIWENSHFNESFIKTINASIVLLANGFSSMWHGSHKESIQSSIAFFIDHCSSVCHESFMLMIKCSIASIVSFADYFVLAFIRGTTSEGRSYIVIPLANANVTVRNATFFKASDSRVPTSLIQAWMHEYRQPLTWSKGFLFVAVVVILVLITIMVLVALRIVDTYRSWSKMR